MTKKENHTLKAFRICLNCLHCRTLIEPHYDNPKRAYCNKGRWVTCTGTMKTYTIRYLRDNRSIRLMNLALKCKFNESMED